MATRKLHRDSNNRMFVKHNGKTYEVKGSIDCMYRATNLVKVSSTKWSGKAPKPPFQFLGVIDGDDLQSVVKADGVEFGSGAYCAG